MTTSKWRGKRVGVLMGGISSERAVSLETGRGVFAALGRLGYDVVELDWATGINVATMIGESGCDVIWNALHGTHGEDGDIQGLLNCIGISCTGSGVLASALAMDKIASKRLYDALQIPTPPWRLASDDRELRDALARFGLPLVIKPGHEGSSVGVSVVKDRAHLQTGFDEAIRHGGPALIEKFIAGQEIQTGLLNDRVLGSIEVRPATGFYDYEAKYERDDTQYIIPPELDPSVVTVAEEAAHRAYVATGCSGHARVDIRVSAQGEPFVLEVNTLPGMTSHSLLPKIAAHVGMNYDTLCDEILQSAVPANERCSTASGH